MPQPSSANMKKVVDKGRGKQRYDSLSPPLVEKKVDKKGKGKMKDGSSKKASSSKKQYAK
jgi:hypothetical protein